ncbi:MAG: hypothetical protein HPY80_06050 [Bacteroidales bacterium]|nr:hypothetical protein [Bacteroidales bacterium]NPV36214.1 hypothetical protein [Bacteroidales bacterium]
MIRDSALYIIHIYRVASEGFHFLINEYIGLSHKKIRDGIGFISLAAVLVPNGLEVSGQRLRLSL